ncbi:hypothetical protein ACWIUD_09780 [Helicobacter sp. 23-1044]
MKQKLFSIAIFFISFLAGILFFGAKYFTFGLSFEDLLVVVTMPLIGTNQVIIELILKDSLLLVLLPSILCAIFITFLPNIWRNKFTHKCYIFIKQIFIKIFANSVVLRFFICICFFVIGFILADKKLQITTAINNHYFASYSTIYEENYITPKISDFKTPKNKRNLIVIFAESIESTFSSDNNPYELIELGGA